MKIYSAVKLPEHVIKLFSDKNYELDMHDELTTPTKEEILSGTKVADALITGVNTPVDKDIIGSGTNLKVISNVGAGYNHIDIVAAKEHNIAVTNSPADASTDSTAENAIMLMLMLSRDIKNAQPIAEENNFNGWQVMGYLGGNQVTGKTLAIIGLGTIGQRIAQMAQAFDMKIIYVDLEEKPVPFKRMKLEDALPLSDFVVLQMNYTPENHHMISENTFDLMKPSSFLINNARGGIVDETALADALDQNKIKGAALDVHEFEPEISDKLQNRYNVILTPHIGNDTIEARNAMAQIAVEQAIKALKGDILDYRVN